MATPPIPSVLVVASCSRRKDSSSNSLVIYSLTDPLSEVSTPTHHPTLNVCTHRLSPLVCIAPNLQ